MVKKQKDLTEFNGVSVAQATQDLIMSSANKELSNLNPASAKLTLESINPETIERLDRSILKYVDEILEIMMDIARDEEVTPFARIAAGKTVIDNGSRFLQERIKMAQGSDRDASRNIQVVIGNVGFNPSSNVNRNVKIEGTGYEDITE